MRRAKIFAALIVAVLCSPAIHGQEGPPLTSAHVEGFVGAMADLKDWSDEHAEEFEGLMSAWDPGAEEAASPLSSAVAALEGHEALDEIRGVLKKHGFDGVESWAGIGDRIIRAYAALKMEEEQPDIGAELAEALEQIEESDMPEQQKEGMRAAILSSQKMVASFTNAPEQDKAVVAPHLEMLERAFEEGTTDYR